MSNTEIQRELGHRLKRERLNQNITQARLAELVNISRRTLVAAEQGEGTTLETFIRILRGLGKLSQLDNFLPEPPISPVQLAKLKGKTRKKASGFVYPTVGSGGGWVWKEDS